MLIRFSFGFSLNHLRQSIDIPSHVSFQASLFRNSLIGELRGLSSFRPWFLAVGRPYLPLSLRRSNGETGPMDGCPRDPNFSPLSASFSVAPLSRSSPSLPPRLSLFLSATLYFAKLTRWDTRIHASRRVYARIRTRHTHTVATGRVLRTVAASAVSNSTAATRPEIPGVRIPPRLFHRGSVQKIRASNETNDRANTGKRASPSAEHEERGILTADALISRFAGKATSLSLYVYFCLSDVPLLTVVISSAERERESESRKVAPGARRG